MRNDGTHAGPAKNKRIKADEALESRPSLPEPEVKEQDMAQNKVEYSLNMYETIRREREHTLFFRQKDEIKTNIVN